MHSLSCSNLSSFCCRAGGRGRGGFKTMGVSIRSSEHGVALSLPEALLSDASRLAGLQNCRNLDSFAVVIAESVINDFPELRNAMHKRADEWSATSVAIHHLDRPSDHRVVTRGALLEASTSFATMQDFLKCLLDIPADQHITVMFSRDAELGTAGEVELTEQLTNELSLAALVGFAGGWFVRNV